MLKRGIKYHLFFHLLQLNMVLQMILPIDIILRFNTVINNNDV